MAPEEYGRQDIEVLNEVQPYCFESDREEQWFKVGLQYGLDAADAEPLSPWISVKNDLPCNHEELIDVQDKTTKKVIVMEKYDGVMVDLMKKAKSGVWYWRRSIKVLYWTPIPEPPKE